MAAAPRVTRPQSVLFACGLNSVRSPMAAYLFQHLIGFEGYVASAGVRKSDLDPFAVAAMQEIGIDMAEYRPITFEEIGDRAWLNFDLIVTLSPEAHHRVLDLINTPGPEVEYWPTPDPSAIEGSRDMRMAAYREVREQLINRIRQRFGAGEGGERQAPA